MFFFSNFKFQSVGSSRGEFEFPCFKPSTVETGEFPSLGF